MDPQSTESIPLLADLSPKVRARVLENAKRRTYKAGDVLVREGDSALYLYIVAAGHALVERAAQGYVGRIGPGGFFGELALIEEHDRTATVTAEDELTCYLLPAWEFKALLTEHPEIALPILRALIARIHSGEHHKG